MSTKPDIQDLLSILHEEYSKEAFIEREIVKLLMDYANHPKHPEIYLAASLAAGISKSLELSLNKEKKCLN